MNLLLSEGGGFQWLVHKSFNMENIIYSAIIFRRDQTQMPASSNPMSRELFSMFSFWSLVQFTTFLFTVGLLSTILVGSFSSFLHLLSFSFFFVNPVEQKRLKMKQGLF